jgi:hypothetical protein
LEKRHTDGEALDGFVFGCAASTVGATDWLGVSTTMLVATVISRRHQFPFSYEGMAREYLLLRVMVATTKFKK